LLRTSQTFLRDEVTIQIIAEMLQSEPAFVLKGFAAVSACPTLPISIPPSTARSGYQIFISASLESLFSLNMDSQ
jgi:hypothetical protein